METNLVVLRDVLEADLSIFYEHQLDTEAAQMAEFPSRDWASFSEHWKKVLSEPSNILKTILVDGQVAGNIVSWKHEGEQEVGYWIGREYWGNGIATAALTEFLALIKTRPLYGYIAKHNAASRRVLEKCGFAVCREDGAEFSLVLSAG